MRKIAAAVLLSLSAVFLRAAALRPDGPEIYQELKRFRCASSHGFPGDNTRPWGNTYTKPTNVGLDLLSTLAAARAGFETAAAARAHVEELLKGVESLETYRGIFPEFIKLEPGVARGEIKDGRTRYSTIDSAWLHFALGVAAAHYAKAAPALSRRLKVLVDKADYTALLRDGRLLSHGVSVSTPDGKVEMWPYDYENMNSEVRPLAAFLVATGKLPASVWGNMIYRFVDVAGLRMAEGWKKSAFVEMTGNIFFDEAALAPGTLGRSHAAYLAATRSLARGRGFSIYGWAPGTTPEGSYTEYGLDNPAVVSPYAASLLATLDDAGARGNLEKVMESCGEDPSVPLPDALDSRTGKVVSRISLALDQNLFFLAAHKDAARALVAEAPWAGKAAALLRGMDVERKDR